MIPARDIIIIIIGIIIIDTNEFMFTIDRSIDRRSFYSFSSRLIHS